LLVASDRISTFDVVLPTEIPDKGRVLTGLSAFWFARTRDICAEPPARAAPDGRSTECRALEMLPIECVVRGYSPVRAGRTTRDRRGLRPRLPAG
jgi:phosphoribosylaminoimidazole-succinocarboxamide synthase